MDTTQASGSPGSYTVTFFLFEEHGSIQSNIIILSLTKHGIYFQPGAKTSLSRKGL